MNQNISRIIKIVLFIFVIVVTDRLFGLILRRLYFNQTGGQDYSLSYVLSKCDADIVIFGNSRAQHHYDSRIISAGMKMSCYNAGLDGGHSILLPYAEIKVLTERYSPKIIVMEFFPTGIVHFDGDYDRLSVLLPYYQDYPAIHSFLQLRGPYEKIKLMSSIYPFNSDIINIIGFNTNTRIARRHDYEGYIPLNEVLNPEILKIKPEYVSRSIMRTQSSLDTNMVNALENIISICKEKNIALYIINSPVYHMVNEIQTPASGVAKISLDIIHRNHVNFLDFSNDPAFVGHPELFADKGHLNYKGAKVFSNMVINSLSKTIENNAEKEKLTMQETGSRLLSNSFHEKCGAKPDLSFCNCDSFMDF